MASRITKQEHRISRHRRVRAKVSGTAQRPRIAVFKSARHMYVQVIDDAAHVTLIGRGDFDAKMKVHAEAPKELGAKAQRAFTVGVDIATELAKKHITEAIFDRGGFKYHGRVKAVADGLRFGGIRV